jgi:hypothetical protein
MPGGPKFLNTGLIIYDFPLFYYLSMTKTAEMMMKQRHARPLIINNNIVLMHMY